MPFIQENNYKTMTIKLIQKRFLKGRREFEIIDESVFVRIKSLFGGEKITVGLSMLNPEPVENGPELEFHSRYKSRPLLSLLLNKPNTEEFNAFVDVLKQRILEESDAFAGSSTASTSKEMARNVYDEPPEFAEPEQDQIRKMDKPVNVSEVENAIHMLKSYVQDESITPLISALEALKSEPQNEEYQQQLVTAFNALGITQGAVLTYAPYLSVFVSDDPFGSH